MSEEALHIAKKRREAKGKGEKERYIRLNAEFQRIARRDKKTFLSDQCKEIEANNRMGKTSNLFKKIRASKGSFHAKMGSIKDRNGMDLTEAEGKGFGIVNKAEIDAFLELSCFFHDPADVGNLISGSSAFSKTSAFS